MTLLDTNVLVYAMTPSAPLHHWAFKTISSSVIFGGACVNAIVLAEVCVGDDNPEKDRSELRSWGILILDVPQAASELCARIYRTYRERRFKDSGFAGPTVPIADFFIGAHAQHMGWEIATADKGRFATYFPSVKLRVPD